MRRRGQIVCSWRWRRWCSQDGYRDVGGSLSGIAYLQLEIASFATLQPFPSDLWVPQSGDLQRPKLHQKDLLQVIGALRRFYSWTICDIFSCSQRA